jgi:hypothetical protein
MSERARFPHLPYALLGALSLACFGGPVVILVAVRGGESASWPPDRPLEWVTIALVLAIFIGLFLACITFGWWNPALRRTKGPRDR